MSFSTTNFGCKVFHYIQTFPIAASSLCLLMLSLDRYATVKHPRFTQLRQRQYLPSILSFVSWIGSGILCIPFIFAYKVTTKMLPTSHWSLSDEQKNDEASSFFYHDGNLMVEKNVCSSDYGSDEWHLIFIVTYVCIGFIGPCFGIIFNHLGVRRKLCALSLTARAQHGELPLPMPTILRRPTHMILVTGMTANGLNVQESSQSNFLSPQKSSNRNSKDSESNQCALNRLNCNRRFNGSSGSGINPSSKNGVGGTAEEHRTLIMETKFLGSGPKTPRSVRHVQNQQKRARLPLPPCPPAELPLPQTSTLRSRRRLANILVAAGFIYMLCWLPHVCCLVIREFSINDGCSSTKREFFMLLGFTHSAVSPIIHWILNYNSLRQSSCQPFAKFNSAQRFLRSHLRFTGPPPAPPSSTNEAALGPFNPKFIKQRPQTYKPPASSHFLY
ncbi:CLUMA_CG006878, isoform A [Clunio marinus]|uniref:CLUMA_CG006878, isoform A n=1 Tax=Clunio marinus TaxID=568069 RepID=A0A1J1I4M5_9DIPT|nr:CLUMA_CG006878, isoform A [Clunio marinus]